VPKKAEPKKKVDDKKETQSKAKVKAAAPENLKTTAKLAKAAPAPKLGKNGKPKKPKDTKSIAGPHACWKAPCQLKRVCGACRHRLVPSDPPAPGAERLDAAQA
jgi:hypothetical protein